MITPEDFLEHAIEEVLMNKELEDFLEHVGVKGMHYEREASMVDVKEFIKHISEKSWSDYTSADYSLSQWCEACLIHQHEGVATSKSQCKLPVKTPNGAINRNGVHAAAAALAGARGGVNASTEEKASAARALRGLYAKLDEDPPDSLKQSNYMLENFLQHVGVKGMHWGTRKGRTQKETKIRSGRQKIADRRRQLSEGDLKKFIERLESEKKLKALVENDIKPGRSVAKKIMSESGQKVAKTVIVGAALYATKVALEKKFDPREAAQYVAPRPKNK